MKYRRLGTRKLDATDLKKTAHGQLIVSDTICPAMRIMRTRNIYSRAMGVADQYWPWAVFFPYLN